jgi:hypothetical protein
MGRHRQGEDPLPNLCEIMRAADAHDAAFSVDQLMAVVARTARRPVAIHCPRCPYLSIDEKHLLHAANLPQSGKSELAERALLSAHGAEFALGPLEGLGELFIVDINYLSNPDVRLVQDPLRYETAMLSDWFRTKLFVPKPDTSRF